MVTNAHVYRNGTTPPIQRALANKMC